MLRQVNMILLPDFLTPVTRRIARLVLSRRPFKQPCNVGEAPEPLRSNLTRADGEGDGHSQKAYGKFYCPDGVRRPCQASRT
jgi:hypothetical protein